MQKNKSGCFFLNTVYFENSHDVAALESDLLTSIPAFDPATVNTQLLANSHVSQ